MAHDVVTHLVAYRLLKYQLSQCENFYLALTNNQLIDLLCFKPNINITTVLKLWSSTRNTRGHRNL